MQQQRVKKRNTNRLPSFQLERDHRKPAIIKLSRSCSHEGLFEQRGLVQKRASSRNFSTKKAQLSNLLNAVVSANQRQRSNEPSVRTASKATNSKNRLLSDNKSLVSSQDKADGRGRQRKTLPGNLQTQLFSFNSQFNSQVSKTAQEACFSDQRVLRSGRGSNACKAPFGNVLQRVIEFGSNAAKGVRGVRQKKIGKQQPKRRKHVQQERRLPNEELFERKTGCGTKETNLVCEAAARRSGQSPVRSFRSPEKDCNQTKGFGIQKRYCPRHESQIDIRQAWAAETQSKQRTCAADRPTGCSRSPSYRHLLARSVLEKQAASEDTSAVKELLAFDAGSRDTPCAR